MADAPKRGKRPAPKSTGAKKTGARRSSADPGARKPAASKTTARKPAARKPATRKAVGRKPAPRKSATRKPSTTVAAKKKPVARASAARKPSARTTTAERTPARKPIAPPPPFTEEFGSPPAAEAPVVRSRSRAPYIITALFLIVLVAAGATVAVRHNSSAPTPTPAPTAPPAPNFSADGFSIHFPTPPQRGSLAMELAGTRIALHLYAASAQNGTLLVEVMDLPSSVPVTDPSKVLDELARAATVPTNSRVLKTSHLTVHGDPALDMTAQGVLYSQWRIVLHGRRLYVLLGEARSGVAPGFEGFRDSFKVASAA